MSGAHEILRGVDIFHYSCGLSIFEKLGNKDGLIQIHI